MFWLGLNPVFDFGLCFYVYLPLLFAFLFLLFFFSLFFICYLIAIGAYYLFVWRWCISRVIPIIYRRYHWLVCCFIHWQKLWYHHELVYVLESTEDWSRCHLLFLLVFFSVSPSASHGRQYYARGQRLFLLESQIVLICLLFSDL